MFIPLGCFSQNSSSCLPESDAGNIIAFLFGIAPDKAFLAIPVARDTGGLLHHHFTLANRLQNLLAVYFCGAGSALLQLPVRKYPALWCPDFPLRGGAANIWSSLF